MEDQEAKEGRRLWHKVVFRLLLICRPRMTHTRHGIGTRHLSAWADLERATETRTPPCRACGFHLRRVCRHITRRIVAVQLPYVSIHLVSRSTFGYDATPSLVSQHQVGIAMSLLPECAEKTLVRLKTQAFTVTSQTSTLRLLVDLIHH